jgi:hypothetical protein
MSLTVNNHLTVIEKALHRALRLAFLKRYPPVANLAALPTAITAATDGGLVYVTAEGNLFEWSASSQTAPDGVNVIAMAARTLPGRWLRVLSPLTWGANQYAPLQKRATGYCKAVELYEGSKGPQDQLERVFAQTPSMLLQWTGDSPQRRDQRPGRVYWNKLSFNLLIGASNYRSPPAAQVGDDFGSLGLMDIIGDARYFLAGLDNLDPDVEYVEIGDADIEDEEVAERAFIATLAVTVKCSYLHVDEDLQAYASQVQPKLTDVAQGATCFDVMNYVAQGYQLTVGPGLTRSYLLGLAIVAGATVSSTPADATLSANSDTYRDLNPDGTITYSAVANGADPPAATPGALRIACTVTDDANIVADNLLCSSSLNLGPAFPVPA